MRPDGSAPLRINESGSLLAWSPDYEHLVNISLDWMLQTVHIDGGPAITLSQPGQDVSYPQVLVTPDGEQVVFRARQSAQPDAFDLFSVPLLGGPTTLLNDPIPADRSLGYFVSSPDSRRVVYSVNKAVSQCDFGHSIITSELYSVPIEGGPNALLSETINGSLQEPRLIGIPQVTADGTRVVYLDGFLPCKGGGRFNLLSVPIDGGAPERLSFSLDDGASGVRWFSLSPDGQWALFVQSHNSAEPVAALYAVPVAGGPPIQLSAHTPLGGFVLPYAIDLSADGQYLVYAQEDIIWRQGYSYQYETNLYSVRIPTVPEPSALTIVLGLVMARLILCQNQRLSPAR
jgi:Tol biopolymer transport system component